MSCGSIPAEAWAVRPSVFARHGPLGDKSCRAFPSDRLFGRPVGPILIQWGRHDSFWASPSRLRSQELGFGKCKLCVQAPVAAEVKDVRTLSGKRIVTSFPLLCKKFFDKIDDPENPTSECARPRRRSAGTAAPSRDRAPSEATAFRFATPRGSRARDLSPLLVGYFDRGRVGRSGRRLATAKLPR